MVDFHGVKVAILVDGKLLVYLRDNKPGLFHANMWDFPGGGREGRELPYECAIREIYEEFEIKIKESNFIWQKTYPAQKDPNQKAFFLVASIDRVEVGHIVLHEGQKWTLMSQDEFLSCDSVIPAIQERFRDFLNK